MANKEKPNVAIFLCTFQGQHYLREQLDSFQQQSYTAWDLWTSDDGSKDGTHAILEEYQSKWGDKHLSIHYGPQEGFVANFLSLTCNANIQADVYAYSDQDDIWEPEKLTRAIDKLQTVASDIPAIYCGRTRLVDKNNNDIGSSPIFKKAPSFSNALVQNIGGGNTMVFNHAARMLLSDIGEDVKVISHDWWAYMVISGCGGYVFYDTWPSLRYRQHEANLVGANSSWFSRWARIRMLWEGRFKSWNDLNLEALHKNKSKLTPENQEVLECLLSARKFKLIPRLRGIRKSGVYRQTFIGNLGLVVAAIFNKL